MLVDIHRRWAEAERILGPALETLPVILTIPVILFLIGLLDNISSAALGSPHASAPVMVAASLSAIAIILVGIALLYTLIHACINPDTSPFRTTISQYIYTLGLRIKRRFTGLFKWISEHMHLTVRSTPVLGWKIQSKSLAGQISRRIRSFFHPRESDVESQSPKIEHEKEEEEEEPTLEQYMANDQYLPRADRVYHATLQTTHEDVSLDQAAAAFPSICENNLTRNHFYYNIPRETRTLLSDLEIKSLVHLLSPEASYRCNLTASESILRLNGFLPEKGGYHSTKLHIQLGDDCFICHRKSSFLRYFSKARAA